MRALNDTKSAFVGIEFANDFFDNFMLSSDLRSFSCKVAVKPICVLFRNLKAMKSLKVFARQVMADHELVFEALLYNDIVRTYCFRYSDCEVMSAVFRGDNCSCLRTKPAVFSQLMVHMQQAPQVCLEAGQDTFMFRSFYKADMTSISGHRHTNTGLNVNVSEFDEYDFRSPSQLSKAELIFCTKELQAFLGFAEVVDAADFDLQFSEGGRPMKFFLLHTGFQTSLVLATIDPQIHVDPTQRDEQPDDFVGNVPIPPDLARMASTRPEGSTSFIDSAFLLPSQTSEPSQNIRPIGGRAIKRFIDEFSDSES